MNAIALIVIAFVITVFPIGCAHFPTASSIVFVNSIREPAWVVKRRTPGA